MPPPVEQYSEREGLPVEEIKQFYRDLYSEMKVVVKKSLRMLEKLKMALIQEYFA